MPIYEYQCDDCFHRFEIRQGFEDAPLKECPKCKGLTRRIFQPAPIIFKGSGFYVTDYRAKSSTAEAGDKPAAAPKPADSKPAAPQPKAETSDKADKKTS